MEPPTRLEILFRIQSTCALINQHLEEDVNEMEGKPVDGKLLGEMLGKQAAAIDACARMISSLAGMLGEAD